MYKPANNEYQQSYVVYGVCVGNIVTQGINESYYYPKYLGPTYYTCATTYTRDVALMRNNLVQELENQAGGGYNYGNTSGFNSEGIDYWLGGKNYIIATYTRDAQYNDWNTYTKILAIFIGGDWGRTSSSAIGLNCIADDELYMLNLWAATYTRDTLYLFQDTLRTNISLLTYAECRTTGIEYGGINYCLLTTDTVSNFYIATVILRWQDDNKDQL